MVNRNYRERGEGKRIKIMQVNLHKNREATIENSRLMNCRDEAEFNISLVQEPCIVGNTVNGYNDVNVFQYTGNEKVRAAVIVSRGLNVWPLPQFCSGDQAVVAFRNNGRIVVCSSTYFNNPPPPAAPVIPPPEIFKRLTLYCERNDYALINGADCNSHSKIWGCKNENQRGTILADYILSKNLHVINVGNKPTFENAIRKEILDITICNELALNIVEDWKVSGKVTFSDHKLIEFFLKTDLIDEIPTFRNVKKTNWDNYKKDLGTLVKEINFDDFDIEMGASLKHTTIIAD